MATNELITSIEYFPFLRAFWSNDGTYERLTKNAKEAHLWRFYELLARDQPQLMQMLNSERNVYVIDAIHESVKHENRQPGFTYIKTRPLNDKTKIRLDQFSSWIREEWRRANDLDLKDFDFICEMHPDIMIEGMESIENSIECMKKPKKRKR